MADLKAISSGPDKETVKTLVEFAKDKLMKFGSEDLQRQYPVLKRLRDELVASFSTERKDSTNEIDDSLSFYLCAGWTIGEMENGSGVAKSGCSEGHYWTAMVILGSMEGRGSKYSAESQFGLWAAYYVARKGAESIGEVVLASKIM
ncbi:MAG TPA: hypothetical protein VII67_04200 [Acidimicrobiales bacterium]